jgi:hypothetical protein
MNPVKKDFNFCGPKIIGNCFAREIKIIECSELEFIIDTNYVDQMP